MRGCEGLSEGALGYKTLFPQPRFSSYKKDVDAILTADGKQKLIPSLTEK